MGGAYLGVFKEATHTPEDIRRFYNELTALAAQRFGHDEDGDNRVEIDVIDRSRFERMHFHPVPYGHKATTAEERRKILETIMLNHSIACDQLNIAFKLWRMDLTGKETKD